MKSPKSAKPKWVRQAERVKSVTKLTVEKKIGDGSFAAVHACTLKKDKTKRVFALKEIDRKKINQQGILKQVETERDILFAVGEHSNIVRLYAYWLTDVSIYFLMEYVADGDLFDHVMSFAKTKKSIPDRQIAAYMRQIAEGLEFIHEKNIIYRDLKLENILLHKAQDTLVFADFGLSKKLTSNERTKTICGTIQYMAPELLNDEPYGQDTDWWSLGVVAFILITGRYPYAKGHGVLQYDCSASDRYIMYKRISAGNVMFPDTMGETMMAMLQQLLHKNPNARLKSTQALLATEWFRNAVPTSNIGVSASTPTDNHIRLATPPRQTTQGAGTTPNAKTPSTARRFTSFFFRRRSTQPRTTRGAGPHDGNSDGVNGYGPIPPHLSSATTPRRRRPSRALRFRRSTSTHDTDCQFDDTMVANPMREFVGGGTSLAIELEREANAAHGLAQTSTEVDVVHVLSTTRASAELPGNPSTSLDDNTSPTDPDTDLPLSPPPLQCVSTTASSAASETTARVTPSPQNPAHKSPDGAFNRPNVASGRLAADDLPTDLDDELPPSPPASAGGDVTDDVTNNSILLPFTHPSVPSVFVACATEPATESPPVHVAESARANNTDVGAPPISPVMNTLLQPLHAVPSGGLSVGGGVFGDEDSFVIASETSPLSSRTSSPVVAAHAPQTPLPVQFNGARANANARVVTATSNVGSGGPRTSPRDTLMTGHRPGSMPSLGLDTNVPEMPSAKSAHDLRGHPSPHRTTVVRPVVTPVKEPYRRRGSRRNIPKTILPSNIKESTAI